MMKTFASPLWKLEKFEKREPEKRKHAEGFIYDNVEKTSAVKRVDFTRHPKVRFNPGKPEKFSRAWRKIILEKARQITEDFVPFVANADNRIHCGTTPRNRDKGRIFAGEKFALFLFVRIKYNIFLLLGHIERNKNKSGYNAAVKSRGGSVAPYRFDALHCEKG